MNKNFNTLINNTSKELKNICNQSELPLEVLSLIIQNLYLEIQNLIINQNALAEITELQNQLQTKNENTETD